MMEWINSYLIGIGVPVVLVSAGLFFTLRVGLKCAAHPLRMLGGMLD